MDIEQKRAVYLIADYNGKIPMLYRSKTNFMDKYWGVIAGRVEDNESALSAMIREADEEADLKFKNKDLILVHICNRLQIYSKNKKINWIDFYFYSKNTKKTPINNEPDKHSELKMFNINNLPKNTVPYMKFAIKSYLKNKTYSEYGFNK